MTKEKEIGVLVLMILTVIGFLIYYNLPSFFPMEIQEIIFVMSILPIFVAFYVIARD